MKWTTSTGFSSPSVPDCEARNANFDGIHIGKGSLNKLALFLALSRYDEGVQDGGRIVTDENE